MANEQQERRDEVQGPAEAERRPAPEPDTPSPDAVAGGGTDPSTDHPDAPTDRDEPDTFTREYVTQLRDEAAQHRTRRNEATERADALARQLWTERVAALNLLADPADLPYDPELLEDPDHIRQAAEELVREKPHLRSRRIRERVGQGEGDASTGVSLVDILRAGA